MVVMPRRLRIAHKGTVVLEGPLGGEAKGSEIGDYEWELNGASEVSSSGGFPAKSRRNVPAAQAQLLGHAKRRSVRVFALRREARGEEGVAPDDAEAVRC